MSVPKKRRENIMSAKGHSLDLLLTTQRKAWLEEAVLVLGDYKLTRRMVATLCETPSTVSAGLLHRLCVHQGIRSMQRLYDLGLEGLLSYEGTGEAQVWIAVCILHDYGFNVNTWIPPTRLTKSVIASAKQRRDKKTRKERAAA